MHFWTQYCCDGGREDRQMDFVIGWPFRIESALLSPWWQLRPSLSGNTLFCIQHRHNNAPKTGMLNLRRAVGFKEGRLHFLLFTHYICRWLWSIKTTWGPWSLCVFTLWCSQCSTAQTSPWRRFDTIWWRKWWRPSFLPSTWMTRPSTIYCQAGNSL